MICSTCKKDTMDYVEKDVWWCRTCGTLRDLSATKPEVPKWVVDARKALGFEDKKTGDNDG